MQVLYFRCQSCIWGTTLTTRSPPFFATLLLPVIVVSNIVLLKFYSTWYQNGSIFLLNVGTHIHRLTSSSVSIWTLPWKEHKKSRQPCPSRSQWPAAAPQKPTQQKMVGGEIGSLPLSVKPLLPTHHVAARTSSPVWIPTRHPSSHT